MRSGSDLLDESSRTRIACISPGVGKSSRHCAICLCAILESNEGELEKQGGNNLARTQPAGQEGVVERVEVLGEETAAKGGLDACRESARFEAANVCLRNPSLRPKRSALRAPQGFATGKLNEQPSSKT